MPNTINVKREWLERFFDEYGNALESYFNERSWTNKVQVETIKRNYLDLLK